MKGTEEKKNNGHMPSLERRGCQNTSRQHRAKTRQRQRGGSGSPSRRGCIEDRQRGRGTARLRRDR